MGTHIDSFWSLSTDDLAKRLGASATGLASAEAAARSEPCK